MIIFNKKYKKLKIILLVIIGLIVFDEFIYRTTFFSDAFYYKLYYNNFLFGYRLPLPIFSSVYKRLELFFSVSPDEYRRQQILKEEEEERIEQEEYLRNQKEPNYYLEQLKKEPTYFALVRDYDDYVNELYELEFEDTIPVLCFIDFINGGKKSFIKCI